MKEMTWLHNATGLTMRRLKLPRLTRSFGNGNESVQSSLRLDGSGRKPGSLVGIV